jgi:hypothetical protein
MNGVDAYIEGEDRDDEPRQVCAECGQSAEDGCDVACSFHPQLFDRPEPEVEPCD